MWLTICQSDYQRAPALEPSWDNSSTCYDPPSTIQIMCTMWNRTITSSDVEVNFGWPRGGFAVAIVGMFMRIYATKDSTRVIY